MDKYFRYEDVKEYICSFYLGNECDCDGSRCKKLDRLPIADVAPVNHAHWTIKDIYKYELSYGTTAYEPVYECSACKGLTESYLRLDEPIMPEDADFPHFCPNCGAKMNESEDAE